VVEDMVFMEVDLMSLVTTKILLDSLRLGASLRVSSIRHLLSIMINKSKNS